MSSDGSVTWCLGLLREPNHPRHGEAVRLLWERYYGRLVELAHKKFAGRPRRATDEEDAAVDAFDSFYRAAAGGDFPEKLDRDDLWHLLVVFTARKAANLLKHERAKKRGGGRVRPEADLPADANGSGPQLNGVAGREPDPAAEAEAAEQCRQLLKQLGDSRLREVAECKFDGCTNQEIAERLGCCIGTVERKLRAIRTLWEEELGP